MLDLFVRPGVDRRTERGIVGEDAIEVDTVIPAIALHQSRGLDVAQDLRIDFRRIEAIPRDRVECPASHGRKPSAACRSSPILKRAAARLAMAGPCKSEQK